MIKMIRLQDGALIIENCSKCPFHAIRSRIEDYTAEGYCELTGSLIDMKTYKNQVLSDCRLEEYQVTSSP